MRYDVQEWGGILEGEMEAGPTMCSAHQLSGYLGERGLAHVTLMCISSNGQYSNIDY